MTETTYGRLLAIKAAAAGPYRITGRCHDCGEEEGLVNFPRLFATSIAVCRRCRFNRTGIEDRRGMIQATASIAGPEKIAQDSGADWKFQQSPKKREPISGPPTDGEIAVGVALEFERRLIEGADDSIREPIGILNYHGHATDADSGGRPPDRCRRETANRR